MYRIVCGIFFIIGCYGQSNIVSISLNPDDAANLRSSPPIPISTAPEVLERPCRPHDLACIRHYFLHNSKCKPAPGKFPEVVYKDVENRFYPRLNISEVILNREYRGLDNAVMREFFINRATDKLVLGVEFRNFTALGRDTFYIYHRRGREPIVTHGMVDLTFKSVYVTIIIPQVEDLMLEKSDSFAFGDESFPVSIVSPTLGESSDPLVPAAYAELTTDLPLDVAEHFFNEASYLATIYVQQIICDFGIKLA